MGAVADSAAQGAAPGVPSAPGQRRGAAAARAAALPGHGPRPPPARAADRECACAATAHTVRTTPAAVRPGPHDKEDPS